MSTRATESTTPSGAPAPPTPLGRPFGAHLSGVGMANLADGVVATGLPLVAITLTQSPLVMGILTASVWLPWLIVGIPAGVLVDHWDRRRTMIVALSIRALLLSTGVVLALTDRLTIWWLVVLAIGYGVTEVFTDIAAGAQVPALVSREPSRLRRANARLLAVEQVTGGFVGPPVAGAVVTLGAAWVMGIPAAIVVGAVVILSIGLRGRYVAKQPEQVSPTRVRDQLSEGMKTLWRHPVLRPLLIGGGLWNFGSSAFAAVIVLWMVGPSSAGGISPEVWGLVMVALPVGALIGSWLSGRLLSRFTEMSVLVVAWGANAVLNVVPILWPTAWAFAAFLFLVGACGVTGNVITGAIRPRMVPEHVLGKVGGASRVVGYGTMPLGALAGGQVAELYGIPVVLAGVVAMMLIATFVVWRSVPQRVVDAHELR